MTIKLIWTNPNPPQRKPAAEAGKVQIIGDAFCFDAASAAVLIKALGELPPVLMFPPEYYSKGGAI